MLTNDTRYKVGIIVSRGFNDQEKLRAFFKGKTDKISEILTNNVHQNGRMLAVDFALENDIYVGIIPIPAKEGGTLSSTHRIVSKADFILILSTTGSKNAEFAKKECQAQNKKYREISI